MGCARWLALRLTLLLIHGLLLCIGRERALSVRSISFSDSFGPRNRTKNTDNHLLILGNPNPFPLRNLQILESAQHIMLHNEVGLHAELGSFLDGERFRFERFDGAWGGQINGDVGAPFDFKSERFDNAATLIFRVHVDGRG